MLSNIFSGLENLLEIVDVNVADVNVKENTIRNKAGSDRDQVLALQVRWN